MAETTMEARPIPTEEPGKEKKKRKFSFPSAFTILFIVTIIAVICTWFVPAGQYSKLLYDADSGKLEMTTPTGETSQLDATQQTLDDLGVKIDIDQFTSGAITKAVSIPGTYEGLDPHPVSIADIPYSMVWGVIDGIDVMVFILCLGRPYRRSEGDRRLRIGACGPHEEDQGPRVFAGVRRVGVHGSSAAPCAA